MASLHWQLESAWNYIATTTLIASGPGGTALEPHFDFDEVFALQISGTKIWHLVFPGLFPAPTYADKAVAGEWLPTDEIPRLINQTLSHGKNTTVTVVMEAGDLLYLPRGTVHYTEAHGDKGSAHITFGVDSGAVAWGWGGLAHIALDLASKQLAKETSVTRVIRPSAMQGARDTMERHLFHMSLTGFAPMENSLPKVWQALDIGRNLREGLLPAWLHALHSIESSSEANERYRKAVGVFSLLKSSSSSDAVEVLKSWVQRVSFSQVLHEAALRFTRDRASSPWGRYLHQEVLLNVTFVRQHRWAVARAYLDAGEAILEYEKEVKTELCCCC